MTDPKIITEAYNKTQYAKLPISPDIFYIFSPETPAYTLPRLASADRGIYLCRLARKWMINTNK